MRRRRNGSPQRAQTLRAAPFRSAMCTGSGFSHVHQVMAVSFFNAWSPMTVLLCNEGPAERELADGGGEGESAG